MMLIYRRVSWLGHEAWMSEMRTVQNCIFTIIHNFVLHYSLTEVLFSRMQVLRRPSSSHTSGTRPIGRETLLYGFVIHFASQKSMLHMFIQLWPNNTGLVCSRLPSVNTSFLPSSLLFFGSLLKYFSYILSAICVNSFYFVTG